MHNEISEGMEGREKLELAGGRLIRRSSSRLFFRSVGLFTVSYQLDWIPSCPVYPLPSLYSLTGRRSSFTVARRQSRGVASVFRLEARDPRSHV